jgi:hypothetical protein
VGDDSSSGVAIIAAPFTETLLVVAQATLDLKSAMVSAVFALGIAMTLFVVCWLYYHLGRSPSYW